MELNTKTLKKAYTFLSKDKRLKFLIDKFSNEIDIKERYNESYPMAVAFLIIEQQVSFKAAITIKKRFINKVSDLSNDEIINFSDEDLQSIGISYMKVEYIKNVFTFISIVGFLSFTIDKISICFTNLVSSSNLEIPVLYFLSSKLKLSL